MPKKCRSSTHKDLDSPGKRLESMVARIQQMLDPASQVTHNEFLIDRIGNKRQYDVVVRGQFGGRPMLGVMECKDHSRKKGPDAIEAFSKKAENLGANLRMIVSKKGFTKQALMLAKHEGISCLSLLPSDQNACGFFIGDLWYGIIAEWTNLRLSIDFAAATAPITSFDSATVKWQGKKVGGYFEREFLTTHKDVKDECEFGIKLTFDNPSMIEIDGQEYLVKAIAAYATRVYKKKRKWVNWTGDAIFDWHSNQFSIPPKGLLLSSAIESDLHKWQDYDGEIPSVNTMSKTGFLTAILINQTVWDESQNVDVPDLSQL